MNYVNVGCGTRFHLEWINLDMVPTGPGVIGHDLTRSWPLADASCDVVYHSHVLEHIRRPHVPFFLQECHRILKPGGIIRAVVPDLETICRLYLKSLEGALQGDAISQRNYEWMTLEMYDQVVRERALSEMWTYMFEMNMHLDPFVRSRVGIAQPPTERNPSSSRPVIWRFGKRVVDSLSWLKPIQAWRIGHFRLSGINHQWMYDCYSLKRLLETNGFVNVRRQEATTSLIPNWPAFHLDTAPDGSTYKPDSLFMEAVKP